MPYKYKENLSEVKESDGNTCFQSYIEKETIAFRWTFSDINDIRNFSPMALDEGNFSSKKRCGGWALSFHKDEIASKDAWDELISNRPNKYKKIGTHIAKGNIYKMDGKCSEPNGKLHFNLIEYNNVNLIPNFKIIRQLVSDEIMESL